MNVLLDMDPGHDDALALLTALPRFTVLGVTTVAGNQTLDKTTLNARRILTAAGSNVPVVPGYAKPLFRDLVTAANVHGESGLDGYAFPVLNEAESGMHAMAYLADVFSRSPEPIPWVATGPLTNVAAFLIGHPHLISKIASITLMGGAINGGNITPYAEFNIYVDPDAAQYVMTSGLPVRMVGLDVTHRALLSGARMKEQFLSLREPIGEMLYSLFSFYAYHEPNSGSQGMPIHDVLAVAALDRPELFQWRSMPLRVEREDNTHRGSTQPTNHGPGVDVALDIDVPAFFSWLWRVLESYRK